MGKQSLDGKLVWITGASRGIGAAMAEEFARHGARLLLSAPESERARLEQTRQRCVNASVHRVLPFDLAEPEQIQEAHRVAGQVDILVNNAGMTHRSHILETSISVDRRIFEVNYFGPITLTKLVAEDMVRQGSGHIVTIASVLGLFATPSRSAYIAAKHALNGFYEALRSEIADRGVHVTLVFPGFVETELSKHALTGDGARYGKMDPGQTQGMSAAFIAKRVVAGILSRKPRILIAGKERALVYLNRVAPSLVFRIVKRVSVT